MRLKSNILAVALTLLTLGVTKSEMALYIALAGDLASTEVALHNGMREGNPLMHNRAVRIASHVAIGVILTRLSRKNPDKKILLVPTIMFTAVTGWNVGMTIGFTW